MHFIFLQKYIKVNILHMRSVEATTPSLATSFNMWTQLKAHVSQSETCSEPIPYYIQKTQFWVVTTSL